MPGRFIGEVRAPYEPIHIAAAYVFHLPFPMFALIGPSKLAELAHSFQAFEVNLTSGELSWLNLESDSVSSI